MTGGRGRGRGPLGAFDIVVLVAGADCGGGVIEWNNGELAGEVDVDDGAVDITLRY